MFCAECGKVLKAGKKFCIYCGEPIPVEIQKLMEAGEIDKEPKHASKNDAESEPVKSSKAEVRQEAENATESAETVKATENTTESAENVKATEEQAFRAVNPIEKEEEEIKEEEIKEDDDPNRTVLIVEDSGQDTLILGNGGENEGGNDVGEQVLESNATENRVTELDEDDGETELVELDQNRTDFGIEGNNETEHEPARAEIKEQPKKEASKELKFMGHVIDESGSEVDVVAKTQEKAGATSIIIKVLLVVLIVLVLIAAGLVVYFYMDSVKLREKYASEQDSFRKAKASYYMDVNTEEKNPESSMTTFGNI